MSQARKRKPKPPPPVMTEHDDPVAWAVGSAPKFAELVNKIHAINRELVSLSEEPEGRELAKRMKRATTDLKNVVEVLRFSVPAHKCPLGNQKTCQLCSGSGWISVGQVQALPPEMRPQ